jgi:signal transduction histidine kinase
LHVRPIVLHDFLTEHREELLSRFSEKLHARHPDRPHDVVIDTMPAFIDEVIKAERREGGLPEETPLPMDVPHAREHGGQRFQFGFKISEIALDFGLVSDTIGELAIQHGVSIDARSYRLLNACIDNAIAQSLDAYTEQSRKRDNTGTAEWIGSLGHELRNALNTAQMSFGVLRSGQVGLDSQTARVLERSLRRLDRLIAQTLAAATLQVGRAPDIMALDVRELVDDIVAGAVLERAIKIDASVDPGLTIEADPHLIESALSNLVQNAIKFTRTGGHVVVRATRTEDGTVFEVEDECGGLSKSPEELFTPFVQGGDQNSRGVGLGLAITRQAIEAHGGRITAQNRAPKGCVFTSWLPRERHAPRI